MERDRKKDLAVLDNKLLHAGYNLEETEHKLILAVLGGVNPKLQEKTQAHGGLIKEQEGDTICCTEVYWISVKDFATLYDKEVDDSRKMLKQAALELFKKQITFKEPEVGRTSYIRWVQKIVFDDVNDAIGVMWTYDVTKYLCQLVSSFTQLRLGDIAKLKGAYAIRFYELWLARYKERGKRHEVEFTLKELYFSMAVPESRQEYAEFKRRILVPVLKELADKKVIKLVIKERKLGRKVVGLGFLS